MELLLATALSFLPLVTSAPAQEPEERSEVAVASRPTVFAGRVVSPDGLPTRGAVVVTSAGGQTATEDDGTFELAAEVPLDAQFVDVTAVAQSSAGHASLVAHTRLLPAALSATTSVGRLVLASAPSCRETWVPTFDEWPGTDGHVHAFAVFDDGTGPALYAGGEFMAVGGVAAQGIAKWTGSRWSAVGGGFFAPGPSVYALAVFDDGTGAALYAGFDPYGGSSNGISRWDGTSWSMLGLGTNGGVRAIAAFDDGSGLALYAGGLFVAANGVSTLVNRIARWDGATWSAVGGGINATSPATSWRVEALSVFDDGSGPALYAGGHFTDAGGVPASSIARWDGSTWAALGSGVTGEGSLVNALAVFDDGAGAVLHVGGSFTTAGGVSANGIARWNGSSWTVSGSGVDGFVQALTVLDDGSGPALYAGGVLSSVDGVSADGIARWNGSSWSALAGGFGGRVSAIAGYDAGGGTKVYAGGLFLVADGVPAIHIAAWDGSEWSALEKGLDAAVRTVATFDDGSGPALYAGGAFTAVGDTALEHVARWDGTRWTPLANGLNRPVRALAVFDDGNGPALYAGGNFTNAHGTTVQRIARWDGASWSALASGLGDQVSALAVFDDGNGSALYAGGTFRDAFGTPVNRIARWDGTSWSALGSGLSGGTDASVDALVVFDDGSGPALYAGGGFTNAGGVSARRIARWDGVAWSAVGTMFGGAVKALAVFDDGSGPALYAGGAFTNANGVVLNGIARWNGSSWSALGSGMNDDVLALAAFDLGAGPALYAGGVFTTAGGVAANRIARWNGAAWTTLEAGVNAPVHALGVFDDGNGPVLCAGGAFQVSPARDSVIAVWGCARRVRTASW